MNATAPQPRSSSAEDLLLLSHRIRETERFLGQLRLQRNALLDQLDDNLPRRLDPAAQEKILEEILSAPGPLDAKLAQGMQIVHEPPHHGYRTGNYTMDDIRTWMRSTEELHDFKYDDGCDAVLMEIANAKHLADAYHFSLHAIRDDVYGNRCVELLTLKRIWKIEGPSDNGKDFDSAAAGGSDDYRTSSLLPEEGGFDPDPDFAQHVADSAAAEAKEMAQERAKHICEEQLDGSYRLNCRECGGEFVSLLPTSHCPACLDKLTDANGQA